MDLRQLRYFIAIAEAGNVCRCRRSPARPRRRQLDAVDFGALRPQVADERLRHRQPHDTHSPGQRSSTTFVWV